MWGHGGSCGEVWEETLRALGHNCGRHGRELCEVDKKEKGERKRDLEGEQKF